MAVITISREIGSGGAEIGRHIAKRLNYQLVNKEILTEVMNSYGLIEFRNIYDGGFTFWDTYDFTTHEIIGMLSRIMLSVAHMDNTVIVGRGSFAVLRDYSDVINLMIKAPLDQRVHAIMEEEGITDLKKAKKEVQHRGKVRKSFIEYSYHLKWDRLENFDMMFDTDRVSPSLIIDTVAKAARSLEKAELDPETTTSAISSDQILDDTVKDVLKKHSPSS